MTAARLLERRWPLALAFVAVILLSWELLVAGTTPPRWLLAPTQVAAAVWDLTADGELLAAAGISLRRAMLGVLLGATIGVLAGLVAGVSRVAEDFLDTVVSLTYPMPKIALFPVFVVWLGLSDSARVLLIGFSTFYPAFVNALAGTRGLDQRTVWVARNLEAGRWRTFWQVVLRGAMPSVAVGVRISLALAFILTYATESIGASRDGLGFLIDQGFDDLRYEQMYAGVVGFAVLGLAADQLWARISGALLRGQQTLAVGSGR